MPPQFTDTFKLLTENDPFPWQEALYDRFMTDDSPPSACSLPTGLGKTSVIAIWLIALANRRGSIPRRLVYVVNRRTVVDQTTEEVKRLAKNAPKLGAWFQELAVSTLRGQLADNRQWSANPSAPAVICGTVDMIGSRLLFSGYGLGFRSAPLHAAFLGQDTLLVHDESHLEPAFQKLLETIEHQQCECESSELPWPKLQVMALSATIRDEGDEASSSFSLSSKDLKNQDVKKRLEAHKSIHFHSCRKESTELAGIVTKLALENKESGDAVIVFVRSVEDALNVTGQLQKHLSGKVTPLTGTMRGKERDEMVERDTVFARFMPERDRSDGIIPEEGTVYLVCTSAGEVGVNLSADHMVCDLSTFDSMAQRFGRVNRFGERDDTRIDVVYPESFDDKKPNPQRKATLALLERLDGDASPKSLDALPSEDRSNAFAPPPIILPATDMLFDAWSLTSIRNKMPGRPAVAPYLHGLSEWEPNRTSVAWRDEVRFISEDLMEQHGDDFPQSLLDDYPLKSHEILSDRTDRVYEALQSLVKAPKQTAKLKSDALQEEQQRVNDNAHTNLWLVEDRNKVELVPLGKLMSQDKKRVVERLANLTILLSPQVGGLSPGGMLDGKAKHSEEIAYDVADVLQEEREDTEFSIEQRKRIPPNGEGRVDMPANMRLVRRIELNVDDEEEPQVWEWYKQKPLEGSRNAERPVAWKTHVGDVECELDGILSDLTLPDELALALRTAAALHDHGKQREQFQITLGNLDFPIRVLAKSGRPGVRYSGAYRHEFGSLIDSEREETFIQLSKDMQDLVLHVIAAHHGRARPHFPREEVYDPEHGPSVTDPIGIEVPRRFARLQRRYGRWGLAYLESLLRAADWAASAAPSAFEPHSTPQEVIS